MLLYQPTTSTLCKHGCSSLLGLNRSSHKNSVVVGGKFGPACFTKACCRKTIGSSSAAATVAAIIVWAAVGTHDANSIEFRSQQAAETLADIPQMLSGGECSSASAAAAAGEDCKKIRIQRPKSRKAESCTIKCVTTCIRGGEGSPGEGPLNVRRPLVVFKQGFRSRHYCLVECSDICNLIGDGDDGP